MKSGKRPALVVFCREPRPRQTKTRLIGRLTPGGAAALADAFIIDALERARLVQPARLIIAATAEGGAERSRYFRRLERRFGCDLVDQGKGSLGGRMANSLGPLLGAGALLVGTDTPSLPVALLERSLALVARSEAVVCPSLDGGYYAIGLRGGIPRIFTGLKWGGSHVLRDTVSRLKRDKVAYAIGPAWYDVDTWPDVLLLAAHLERALDHEGSTVRSPRSARMRAGLPFPCPATAEALRRLGLLGRGR